MNHFILWKDMRLFHGSHPRSVVEHSHPMIQLVIAVEGLFRSKDKNEKRVSQKGLLIAPNQIHECDANQVGLLSLEIDPHSNLGEWINGNQLKNKNVIEYPSEHFPNLDIEKILEYIGIEDWTEIRQIIYKAFDFKGIIEKKTIEPRIQEVVAFIKGNIKQDISTQQLMDVAHLSESRLLHLFKEIQGLPIRNYILWSRLEIVLGLIVKGQSLTVAAHEAGFSDQAHLTRTFTKMIGVPPSLIAKNSKFIQVSFPESI
ncbi:helix-turn-helix domain-containing protein [Flagellimonas crocea]|uniref:helix-turn-helix domain-containing protein n=1 Tax=Flagellimonas crocea TaxID=3067311 RepID=UPI00296F48FA|nr:AraC family transcriptional regulator [Muricauda sp. DH64]